MSDAPKLTFWDNALGALYAPYKTKAIQHRAAQQGFENLSRRDSRGRKDSGRYINQPIGVGQIRKLTPYSRRVQIQQSREIYENNVLGNALINRAVDNIIGEGMTVKPTSSDDGFNAEAEAWWSTQYMADSMGRFSNSELQRVWFKSYVRDGDIGAIMLRLGQVQTVESDYIQSPNNSGDLYNGALVEPDIVDGFKVTRGGRYQEAYIASIGAKGQTEWPAVPFRNFLFHANYDRANRTAVRGVPKLAIIRPLLEHIDGTLEAVTIAHRMAASFGLLRKMTTPAQANAALPALSTTPSTGDINKAFAIRPGMVESLGLNEDAIQVRAEHPVASFESFMATLVRFAGIPLGLPLELALLDFSKTNYSSARASLEQAYRSFRVEQKRFVDAWLSKWYRWRIAKAVNMGDFGSRGIPDNFLEHKWFAQPWPYLNPVEDAQGVMAAVDAGMTTLTQELARRGQTLKEWVKEKSKEMKLAAENGVPLLHSNLSRDGAGDAAEEQPDEPETPEQPDDEDSELPSEG